MVDSSASRRQAIYKEQHDIEKLREKIAHLEIQLEENDKYVVKLKQKLDDAVQEEQGHNIDQLEHVENQQKQLAPPVSSGSPSPKAVDSNREQILPPKENQGGGNKVQVVQNFLAGKEGASSAMAFANIVSSGKLVCPTKDVNYHADGDIQMLHAYETIPFDNPDGGVWKQGWDVKYDKEKIKQEKKLEVVVIPHSHDDPGWLKTFEGYFEDQTKHILDGMVEHLNRTPDMKFIYAEMSFFELWWSQINDEIRNKARKLIESGQVEIVTGGWVMTDEANSHYFSTVMEMIEGHEFLLNQIGFKPSNHWSIDPFGISPTLAYIMKQSNMSHAAIQRVHYSVKKYLAQQRNLEFTWRQLWAGKSDVTDMKTHMFPFYSYDVPHTCGPEPAICCQFDFKRLTSIGCPWGKAPEVITPGNVAQRGQMLADQYRKKAQLYKNNVILVPLGDDFRYDSLTEWNDQYKNYKMLFDYMNSNKDLNINARFGTLHDYFTLLEKRISEDKPLSILSGDFFTYADRDDHYWSGYFTSRPFYKHMDRTVQHYLRTADILFSLANWKANNSGVKFTGEDLYDNLVTARRAMSLFQHHDGVTGTARDHVVIDYGEKMVTAINNCKQIISKATEYLMKFPPTREQGLKIDEEHFVDKLPQKVVSEDGSVVVVFNPLGQPRQEVVCINVNSWKSRVGLPGESNTEILQQIGPVLQVIDNKIVADKDRFELCFLAEIQALGFARFNIFEADDVANKVKLRSSSEFESQYFETKLVDKSTDIIIENSHLKASFDVNTGLLKTLKEESELDVELSFVHYGARKHNRSFTGGDSLAGAYLFLPDGKARPLSSSDNSYIFVNGPIRKTIFVKGPQEAQLVHVVNLDVNAQSLYITNLVNITTQANFEVAMRLKTSIKEDNFFSDLNAFQMIRRKRFAKLPLQAQYYPMPGSAFIEDSNKRLSLLGRQALGVASLEPGWIEVMLDRRLNQDDDRGLAQGVLDNKRTESQFFLLLETLSGQPPDNDPTIGYHSLPAHHLSLALHYPLSILVGQIDHAASSEIPASTSLLAQAYPCDIHPIAIRTLSQPTIYGPGGTRSTKPQSSSGMVLHRLGVECRSKKELLTKCETSDGKISIKSQFVEKPKTVHDSSLTLMYVSDKETDSLLLNPMELKTVKISF
uniref:Alpha-mannosidase n=2 Tax=Acrobeloides nanus TaxID=290746 RepID=A0A914BV68_9BILA